MFDSPPCSLVPRCEKPATIRRAVGAAGWVLTLLSVLPSLSGCEAPPTKPSTHAVGQNDLGASKTETEPPAEGEPTGLPLLRTVYVPAYSHLPSEGAGQPSSLLSVLLSVRNIDARATITLTHVDYFDTSGHRVRRYLSAPKKLRPLETVEFSVKTMDKAGGSGANFLVYWQGPSDAHPLLTEAVMLGNFGAGYVTFASRGVELKRRPDPSRFAPHQTDEKTVPNSIKPPGTTALEH